MTETQADSEMIEALGADGPHPDHADKLMLFGQFVGSWEVAATLYRPDGTVENEAKGEWRFGWVLEGRAIQDVLSSPLPEDRAAGAPTLEHGSTIRSYDPRIDGWRVTWTAPIYGRSIHLIARPDGEGILLEGRAPNGFLLRWSFNDITPDSFHWRGHTSMDEGRSWFLNEEMLARRRS